MDYNKILPIEKVQPSVHIVNYFTLQNIPEAWGPRTIDDFEMIFIRDGRFSYSEEMEFSNSFPSDEREEGRLRIYLEPGDMLLIPPGVEHIFKTESESGAISCIHNDPVGNLSCGNDIISLSHNLEYKTDFYSMRDLVDNLFFRSNQLFESYQPFRDELLSTLCREIWLRAAAQWDVQFKDKQLSSRMLMMLEYIKANCMRDLSRNHLADEFNLTAEHINSLFKKELNMTPSACINRERILRAYTLIYSEGYSVKEAAFECGFNDPFYFSRVFKKVLGVTPSSLRKW